MGIKRTLTQRKFIRYYIENGGNATEAYLSLRPNAKRNSAKELGYRMLTKVDLSVSELLDKMGMTDARLNKVLDEGLDATKVISVIPIPPKKSKENTTDLPNANSKNVEFIDVPDFNVRVKYLDMALKLKGKFPSEKHDIKVEGELKIIDAKQKLIEKIDKLSQKKENGE